MATENRLFANMCREVYEKIAPIWSASGWSGARYSTNLAILSEISISPSIASSRSPLQWAMALQLRRVLSASVKRSGLTPSWAERRRRRPNTLQLSGSAIKAPARSLLNEFDRNKNLRDVLLRYTQALIAQISQTTACNSLHRLEQRFARWLLESQDHVGSNELELTQEFIADMLGVRRAGVTQAVQKLQESGLTATGVVTSRSSTSRD